MYLMDAMAAVGQLVAQPICLTLRNRALFWEERHCETKKRQKLVTEHPFAT